MLESLITVLVGGGLAGIITYSIVKNMLKTEKIIEILYEITDEIMNSEELQRKFYSLGVLIGNGFKSGVGITRKGGKYSMEDLIAQGLGAFLQQMLGGQKEKVEESHLLG